MTMLAITRDTPDDLAPLIAPIERAIKNDRVTGLAEILPALATSGMFDRPDFYAPPRADRYARRLIWKDPKDRFVVIGLTWAPGQMAALHDHAGLWGAEVVAHGIMAETPYEVVERDDAGRYRFTRGPRRDLHAGSVGLLIPPLEYHEYGNAGTRVARTLHIYGGNLTTSQSFRPDGAWWQAKRVDLRYDA